MSCNLVRGNNLLDATVKSCQIYIYSNSDRNEYLLFPSVHVSTIFGRKTMLIIAKLLHSLWNRS